MAVLPTSQTGSLPHSTSHTAGCNLQTRHTFFNRNLTLNKHLQYVQSFLCVGQESFFNVWINNGIIDNVVEMMHHILTHLYAAAPRGRCSLAFPPVSEPGSADAAGWGAAPASSACRHSGSWTHRPRSHWAPCCPVGCGSLEKEDRNSTQFHFQHDF